MPESSATAQPEEPVSAPLYLAGLVVALCGILAVASTQDPSEGAGFTVSAVSLAVAGFGFSYLCRVFHVKPRIIELLVLAFVAYLAYQTASGRIDWWAMVAGTNANQNDINVATLLAWGAAFASWTLISDDYVIFMCVLTVATLALVGTADADAPVTIYFWIFVLATAFLLIHQNHLLYRRRASAQERAREGMGHNLRAQAVLAGLCALLVLVLGMAIIVPMQIVFSGFSLAQAIRNLVHFGGGAPSNAANLALRFSDDSDLQIGTGSGWSSSPETVMRVQPSDHEEHYWRGRTYDTYNGDGWNSAMETAIPMRLQSETARRRDFAVSGVLTPGDVAPVKAQAASMPITASFQIVGDTDQFYYAVSPLTLTLGAGRGKPRQTRDGRLDLGGESLAASRYLSSFLPTPDPYSATVQARLRQAGTDYPAEVRARYLGGLHNDITSADDIAFFEDAKNQALRGLPPNRRAPIDEALAIQRWVGGHATYSLTVPPIPSDVDHVRDFLGHTHKGYCDMFASSMAVLCRTAGIPARLVTGFAPGECDTNGCNVRAMDKHAWVELYFPHVGWLAFDPTVGSQSDSTVPTRQKHGWFHWAALWNRLRRGGPIPLLLLVGIVLILAYVIKTEIWDRIRARRVTAPRAVKARAEIGGLYATVTRAIGRLGLPRRPSETPAEYAARAVPFLAAREAALGVPLLAQPLETVTAQFIQYRYDKHVGGDVPAELSVGVAQFAAAAARARRLQLWRRVWRMP